MLGLCSAQNGHVLDHQYTSRGLSSAGAGSNTEPSSREMRGSLSSLPSAGSGGALASSAAADTGTTALAEAELKGLSATGSAEQQNRSNANASSNSAGQGRSEAAIRRVLEANKSSLYTLYSRALRANPLLKGKVVFELVIKPDGSLAEVTIVQSELNDSKLERQLVLRLGSVNFGAEAVALTRSQWTVEFLPG